MFVKEIEIKVTQVHGANRNAFVNFFSFASGWKI